MSPGFCVFVLFGENKQISLEYCSVTETSRRNLNLNWHVSRSRLFWTLTAICVDSFHSPLMSCGLRRPNLHSPVPGAPCSCRAHTHSCACMPPPHHHHHLHHRHTHTQTQTHAATSIPLRLKAHFWLTKIWSCATSRGVSVIFLAPHTFPCASEGE